MFLCFYELGEDAVASPMSEYHKSTPSSEFLQLDDDFCEPAVFGGIARFR